MCKRAHAVISEKGKSNEENPDFCLEGLSGLQLRQEKTKAEWSSLSEFKSQRSKLGGSEQPREESYKKQSSRSLHYTSSLHVQGETQLKEITGIGKLNDFQNSYMVGRHLTSEWLDWGDLTEDWRYLVVIWIGTNQYLSSRPKLDLTLKDLKQALKTRIASQVTLTQASSPWSPNIKAL